MSQAGSANSPPRKKWSRSRRARMIDADVRGVDARARPVLARAALRPLERGRLLVGQRGEHGGDPADILGQLLKDQRPVVAADVVQAGVRRPRGMRDSQHPFRLRGIIAEKLDSCHARLAPRPDRSARRAPRLPICAGRLRPPAGPSRAGRRAPPRHASPSSSKNAAAAGAQCNASESAAILIASATRQPASPAVRLIRSSARRCRRTDRPADRRDIRSLPAHHAPKALPSPSAPVRSRNGDCRAAETDEPFSNPERSECGSVEGFHFKRFCRHSWRAWPERGLSSISDRPAGQAAIRKLVPRHAPRLSPKIVRFG